MPNSTRRHRDPVAPLCATGRLLVVADTRATANGLDTLLGHADGVQFVESAAHDAVFTAARSASLLVLDLDSSTSCGLDTLDSLRRAGIALPIVAISASSDEVVATRAYDAGADAVLKKPVAPSALLARCKSLLQRAEALPGSTTPTAPERASAPVGSSYAGDLRLSAMQSAVLEQLARRPGQIVTRQMLLDQLYGGVDTPAAGVIDFFIHGIRRELASSRSDLVIETLRGVGFRLRTKPASA